MSWNKCQQDNLNTHRYIDNILQDQVIPYAAAIGGEFILMDDNATPHRARVTNAFLDEHGISHMEWLPKSPDLNPIEHLWSQLKRRVNKRVRSDTTLDDLADIFIVEWNATDQNRIRRLICSM